MIDAPQILEQWLQFKREEITADQMAGAVIRSADEIERLREELYEIKLAAAGGEDAPGAANMVTAKDIEKWTNEMWRRVKDREAEIERLHRALQKANIEIQAAHELVDALTLDSAALGEGKE